MTDVPTISSSQLGARARNLHASPTSDVYVATLDGAQVVVKRTKITTANDLPRFEKELDLLHACAGHASVLRVLGVVRSAPTYALVLPLYSRGALFALLHASGRRLAPAAVAALAGDVAAAIAHLHACGVLHRDVKTDNVLVDERGACVLADFNAAELETAINTGIVAPVGRPSGGFFKQFVVGTLPYMAPELLRSTGGGSAAYVRACDVYSLGILTCEVSAQAVPYADALKEKVKLQTILEARYNHDELTAAIVSDGLRPNLPTAAPPPLLALIEACWADAAAARPSAADAVAALAALAGDAAALPRQIFDDANGDDAAPPPPRRRRRRRRRAAAGVGAGGAATAAASAASGHPDAEVAAARALAARCGVVSGGGGAVTLQASVEATAGARGADRMEDRHVLQTRGDFCVAAVLDGHNGDACADHCAGRLRGARRRLGGGRRRRRAAAALRAAFPALHASFLGAAAADESGATALAAVVCGLSSAGGGRVAVANAGDCHAVLWRGDGSLLPLARPHTADDAAEAARVAAAGGEIRRTADGKARVQGRIQVTRCLGDRALQPYGLTPEPEVIEAPLRADDRALVLASDGLWDVLTLERVAHCLHHTAKSADLLAKRLIADAAEKGTDDNTTVLVVLLRPL